MKSNFQIKFLFGFIAALKLTLYGKDCFAEENKFTSDQIEEQIKICKSEASTNKDGKAKIENLNIDPEKLKQACQTCCDLQFADEFSHWNRCNETCSDITNSGINEL